MLSRRMLRPLFAYSHATLKRVLSSKPSFEGTLACCTCHVVLEKQHYDSIPYLLNVTTYLLTILTLAPASEEEADMLDLAPELTETSHIGHGRLKNRFHSGLFWTPNSHNEQIDKCEPPFKIRTVGRFQPFLWQFLAVFTQGV
uniref:Uncharacterized protein n=1 Tax=Parascaris equorum TaxID=6256 RepID=A0A914S307_PAREQ